MPQVTRYGFLGKVDVAVVEAADLTAGGSIVLTSGFGGAPPFCNLADRVIIELNRHHPATMLGLHDIYEPADPPYRKQIPIYTPSDRRGSPIITIDPHKIVGWWKPTWRTKPVASAKAARSCRFNREWATSPTRCSARWAGIRESRRSKCIPR